MSALMDEYMERAAAEILRGTRETRVVALHVAVAAELLLAMLPPGDGDEAERVLVKKPARPVPR